MKPDLQILVVADDSQVGRWLQHRIEALRQDTRIVVEASAGFEHRLATTGTAEFSLLIAVLDFSTGASAAAMEWVEHVQGIPGSPPLVVLAEDGDEMSAVGAMRRGAADYLPRRLLSTDLLSAAIHHGLESRRAPARMLSPAPPTMVNPLKVPRDLIPRYMLLDTLGESARATVYLAHSDALDRHVALKVSRVADNDEPQFSREFQTAGSLRHSGIVDIYDYGMHEGREFIAMEYFPCGDLKARLQNPLSEYEALEFLQRIAAALSAVHQQGIVHRDLKPPNIMLRDDGQIVLIDFGISKHIDHGTRSTAAGVLRGSPYYMSPEQAQGLELDSRSDLYSLGVLFYEMLTGSKPYLGATAIEVLQQHVAASVPMLPPELAQHQLLLEGMLAKQREDRFASADALIASLTQQTADSSVLPDAAPAEQEQQLAAPRARATADPSMALLRAAPDSIRLFLGSAMASVSALRATLRMPARTQDSLREKLARLQAGSAQLGQEAQAVELDSIVQACSRLFEAVDHLLQDNEIRGNDLLPLAVLIDSIASAVGTAWRCEEQRYSAPQPPRSSGAGTSSPRRSRKHASWPQASEKRWNDLLRRRGAETGTLVKLAVSGADLVPVNLRRDVDEMLLHLLRNALEHGIETPEQRLAAEKPAAGQISITFEDKGTAGLRIQVRDDGRGFDMQRIGKAAVMCGLISEESLVERDAGDLVGLIFKPAFTTEGLAESDGHGRGMTCLRNTVTRLNGQVSVATKSGRYTQFIVQLPVSASLQEEQASAFG